MGDGVGSEMLMLDSVVYGRGYVLADWEEVASPMTTSEIGLDLDLTCDMKG